MPITEESGPTDRFRILSVDGGGIRGLIPALVIAEVERRLRERAGEEARISDYFHLFAGTSTGGLIALALTAPDPVRPDRPQVSADELAALYVEDGPKIFNRTLWHRLRTVWGFTGPKYSAEPLRGAVSRRLGGAMLAEALREVVIPAYDMTGREPFFFKRWRARQAVDRADSPSETRNNPIVDAALATAAAPTYFPTHELGGRALIDGGVFAANPVVAAITEALKRTESPGRLSIEDLLVVSIGTGLHEEGYGANEVRRWGKLGWILPHGDDPPILGAVLDGASDGADHWAHMLLNHVPGAEPPTSGETGQGPRYYRMQVPLEESIPLDDCSEAALTETLPAAAAALIAARDGQLDEIVERLLRSGPLQPDPPPPAPSADPAG
jgi:hypothetical protein